MPIVDENIKQKHLLLVVEMLLDWEGQNGEVDLEAILA